MCVCRLCKSVQCWPLEEQESALAAWCKREHACSIFVDGSVMGGGRPGKSPLIWEQATVQVLVVAYIRSFQFHNFTDPTGSEILTIL